MAGFPVPFIKFREVNANGDPLAGGWLFSYVAGSSTPLATYTDQDLGTPNANPTELDASGRASIWVEDGVAYKFILKDALLNTIWTQDEVQVPQILAPPAPAEVPTGGMIAYGGATAPAGWLLCDGAGVSRTTYSDLFASLGEAYGAGNGSTTFNVPNLSGRFILGKSATGTGSILGSTGGLIDHVHAGPSHTHTVASHVHTIAHTHTVPRDGWGEQQNVPGVSGRVHTGDAEATGEDASAIQATNDNATGASSASNAGGTALTTEFGGTANTGTANPPFLSLNWIIKT